MRLMHCTLSTEYTATFKINGSYALRYTSQVCAYSEISFLRYRLIMRFFPPANNQ